MDGASYLSVLHRGESVFEDRKSTFLSFAQPVVTEAEAVSFVKEIRGAYPDARHCVYAYVLRENNTVRYTDDGEPQGTAGMPTLDAIRKRNLTDCAVATVRYFGGILLGTGGLVHAYTTAAAAALTEAEIITYATFCFSTWSFAYADYQRIPSLCPPFEAKTEQVDFSDVVRLTVSVPAGRQAEWERAVADATCGRGQLLKEEKKFVFRK